MAWHTRWQPPRPRLLLQLFELRLRLFERPLDVRQLSTQGQDLLLCGGEAVQVWVCRRRRRRRRQRRILCRRLALLLLLSGRGGRRRLLLCHNCGRCIATCSSQLLLQAEDGVGGAAAGVALRSQRRLGL